MASPIKLKILVVMMVATPLITRFKAVAQNHNPHEYSVWGGAGNASLNIKKETGTAGSGLALNMGVGYSYNFSPQWSIGTGVEMTTMGSELEVKDIGESYMTSSASVSYRMALMKEKVTVNQVNIPLMIQYLSKGREHKFYASAGAKIGIPVTSKAKSKATTFATKVSGAGSMFDENMARPNVSTDLNIKTSTMLALELGIKWSAGSNSSIYTGAYLDYRLNNMLESQEPRRLIDYTGGTENNGFEHNSLFNSSYENANGETKYYVNKMTPMTIGFKVRWSFKLGGNEEGVKNYNSDRGRKNARDKHLNTKSLEGMFDNMSPAEIQKRVDGKQEKVKQSTGNSAY